MPESGGEFRLLAEYSPVFSGKNGNRLARIPIHFAGESARLETVMTKPLEED
jgi:hypothetical protein